MQLAVFECSICHNRYNDSTHKPLTLSCGHVYCYECLNTMAARGGNFCPTDKVQYAVPVSQLPCCYAILNHLPDSVGRKLLHCKRHPRKRIKFVCEDHAQFLCSSCVVEHAGAGHLVKPFEVEFKVAKEKAVDLQIKVQMLVKILKKYKEKLEKRMGSLDDYVEKQQAKLKYEYNKVLKLVAQKQKTLLQRFSDEVYSSRNEIVSQLSENNESLAKLKSTMEQLKSSFAPTSIVEFDAFTSNAEVVLAELQGIPRGARKGSSLRVIQVSDRSEVRAVAKRTGNCAKEKAKEHKRHSKKRKKREAKDTSKKEVVSPVKEREETLVEENQKGECYETPEDSDLVNIQ